MFRMIPIRSTVDQTATVRLFANGTLIQTKPVSLTAGLNTVQFDDVKPTEAGALADVLDRQAAKQIETWAKEKNVEVEMDWATFGDREQKFVAAIEAGNPPDVAEMNYQGPMRYRPALRDVTKLAKDLAASRGGLLPYADRVVQFNGQYFAIARLAFGGGLHVRKDLIAEKGLKMPKVYDPDVIEVAKKTQDPSKDLWGFGQTLNRSDDGNGYLQNILWDYGGSVWDKDGKPAPTIAAGVTGTGTLSARAYYGPKDVEILEGLKLGLEKTVDFGWYGILARPLLWMLKKSYPYVGNWGLAILLVLLLWALRELVVAKASDDIGAARAAP